MPTRSPAPLEAPHGAAPHGGPPRAGRVGSGPQIAPRTGTEAASTSYSQR